MALKDTIDIMKRDFNKNLKKHSDIVRDHIAKYGTAPCDYLDHNRNMSNYFMGKYNALIELEKRLL